MTCKPTTLQRLRQHLGRVLSGMGSLFGAFAPRGYVYPQRGDRAQDLRQLGADWRQVGGDMRAALRRERKTRPRW